MSKREKLIAKIKNNPKAVRFETLQKLLLSEGFRESQKNRGSSHYTYTRGKDRTTVVRETPINEFYVKRVLGLIGKRED